MSSRLEYEALLNRKKLQRMELETRLAAETKAMLAPFATWRVTPVRKLDYATAEIHLAECRKLRSELDDVDREIATIEEELF